MEITSRPSTSASTHRSLQPAYQPLDLIENQKIARFLNWLRDNGAIFDHIDLATFEGGLMGIAAKKDIGQYKVRTSFLLMNIFRHSCPYQIPASYLWLGCAIQRGSRRSFRITHICSRSIPTVINFPLPSFYSLSTWKDLRSLSGGLTSMWWMSRTWSVFGRKKSSIAYVITN